MIKNSLSGALLLAIATLSGCASNQPLPELKVETIPQPTFNILKIHVDSEIVRVPTIEQTVVCNGCDQIPTGVVQEDDVIWIRMTPAPEETIIDAKHFDFDKAVLKGDLSKLTAIADKMKADSLLMANIVGHTDSIGKKSYNYKLGLKRANAVKRWLVNQGIDAKRIDTSSKGETSPIASNKTKSGRAKNRRAVITINVTE
ncbi:OmpA family protein [Acinetobacter baumannii]